MISSSFIDLFLPCFFIERISALGGYENIYLAAHTYEKLDVRRKVSEGLDVFNAGNNELKSELDKLKISIPHSVMDESFDFLDDDDDDMDDKFDD